MDKLVLKLGDSVVEIDMDDNGRYSLNDLFKASGSVEKKKPYRFLNDSDNGITVIKIHEISDVHSMNPKGEEKLTFPEDFESYVVVTGKGRGSKTFAPIKVVYKYAAFISKEFEDAVYSAFTALSTGDIQGAANIASSVALTPEILAKYDKEFNSLKKLIDTKYDSPHIYTNIFRLLGKAVTGYTPMELSDGMGVIEWVKANNHFPAMNAYIASIQNIKSLLVIGVTDYHHIAVTLGVKTSKNGSLLDVLEE